jgi:hypothetical protein
MSQPTPPTPSEAVEDAFWDDFRMERKIEARMGVSARRDSRTRLSERILNELTGVTGELLPQRSEAADRAFWSSFFEESKRLSEDLPAPIIGRGEAA